MRVHKLRRIGRHLGAWLVVVPLSACGDGSRVSDLDHLPVDVPEDAPVVVFLGDSLTAGPNLSPEETYPTRLERRFVRRDQPFRALNAGVNGDTTRGGLARLERLMKQWPDVVVVALGANDGLRSASLERIESNLDSILERVAEDEVPCVLLGQRIPPTLGSTYARDFHALYARLAERHRIEFVPFLLEDVAGVARLNLPDGVHPNAEGHRILADNVEDALADALDRVGQTR